MTISLKGKHGLGKILIIDDEDYSIYLAYFWSVHKQGYLTYHSGNGLSLRFHRLVIKAKPKQLVDHINGNRLDNRKCNLRLCDSSKNLANRGPQKNNKSGYKGVSWSKQRNKWIVQIAINKKQTNLGSFTDIVEAAKMYDTKAIEVFGEFAKTNFPIR